MFRRGILLQTFLVIVASVVLGTVESQIVSVYPPSIGVQSGEENVLLDCNVTGLPANNYIAWMYFPPWMTTGFMIYSTFDGINRDPTNFTVSHTTSGSNTQSLELVIKTAKRELATQYLCNLSPTPGFEKTAYVVALDPIECPGDIVEYDEGSEANISCSINFYDSTLTYFPHIMWYRDGQTISGVYVIVESSNRRTVRLTKNVTSVDDDQKFDCVVDFYNSNPDYTDNCSTQFYVRHNVSEISFYPPSSAESPTNVAVGEVINCKANGRPAPSIVWYDINGNSQSNGSELIVTEDLRTWVQPITLYCMASNTIDNGVTFAKVESNYTFNAVEATSDGTVRPTGTTTRASTLATGTTSAPQYCGTSYYYGPAGVISSPNYPGNYSNYQSCNYYVDTSSPSSSIAVVFTAFDTEQCCDYVTISCPEIPLYPSLRYSGAFLPQPFSIPRCSQAAVNFITDGSTVSTGFSLDYYVNLGDCGDTVYTESHDYISSPNYPNSHDNNLNCSNIIWARLRSSFTINFLDMDLEECCDFVELSCIDNAEYGRHRFSGSSIPPKQDIPGCTQVLVWFHSDDSLVKPGFNLEYFANPDPDDLSQRKVSSNGMPNAKESGKGEERWSHH